MVRTSLPPGFRFHPTDVELLMYYLKRKVMGKKLHFEAISELNLYKFSPWDLPDKSCLKSKDLEWYFFCPRERKYASGARMNRATETGYWKTTGKDRSISYDDRIVGMVKTLVFHEGGAPRGKRTDWVIHEYRLDDTSLAQTGVVQDSFVLCKIFQKSGPGPKNGAQYGAPFKEEEWEDDEVALPSDGPLPLVHAVLDNQSCSVATGKAVPGKGCGTFINESGPSVFQCSSKDDQSMAAKSVDFGKASGLSLTNGGQTSGGLSASVFMDDEDDDIGHLLSAFCEDGSLLSYANCNLQVGDHDRGVDVGTVLHSVGRDSLNSLGLSILGSNVSAPASQCGSQRNLILQDDASFIELDDLNAPLKLTMESSGVDSSSGGIYAPCLPLRLDEGIYPGMTNSSNTSNGVVGQPFYSDHFLVPQPGFPGLNELRQPSFPGLNELPLLSNSPDGLHDPINIYQNGNEYGSYFNQGLNTTNNIHSTSYVQPEEVRGAGEIWERGRSHYF